MSAEKHPKVLVTAPVAMPLGMTDVARVWRKVYGGTRMDSSAAEFADALMREVMERTAASELLESLQELVEIVPALRPTCSGDERAVERRLERAQAVIAKANGSAS